MQRFVSGIAVLLSLALPAISPNTARALGVFEDAPGEAGFLFARHQTSVGATFHRTSGPGDDASVFALAAYFPARRGVLVQVEQPFIAVARPSDIESAFGDLTARARVRLLGANGRALSLLGCLRAGSGTARLYPYSSQSYDMQLGVGYVDSLRVVHVWAMAEGIVTKRVPKRLTDDTKHEDFARLAGGLTLPLGRALAARGGGTALLYRSGGRRALVFAELQYDYTSAIEIVVSGQAETLERARRVSDYVLTAGIRTYF